MRGLPSLSASLLRADGGGAIHRGIYTKLELNLSEPSRSQIRTKRMLLQRNFFILVDVRLINLKGPPLHSDDDLIIDVRRASALGKSGWQRKVLRWAFLFLRHGHFFR